MKNINLFNREGLKSFRSSLRNRSTSAEAALWNILKSRNLDGAPHGEYHRIQEDENRDKYNQPPRPGSVFATNRLS